MKAEEANELRKQLLMEAEKIRQVRMDEDWGAYWESYRESFGYTEKGEENEKAICV